MYYRNCNIAYNTNNSSNLYSVMENMIQEINLNIPSSAIFSEDGKYRYSLWRIWDNTKSNLMLIGLNPSKADEYKNDPTITRAIERARRNNYGGLLMANLYAYVSTDPKALLENDKDNIGELNDYYIKEMIEISERQLCGWGSFKAVTIKGRDIEVMKMLINPYCLGINRDGQPKHPLYVSYNTPMERLDKII